MHLADNSGDAVKELFGESYKRARSACRDQSGRDALALGCYGATGAVRGRAWYAQPEFSHSENVERLRELTVKKGSQSRCERCRFDSSRL